ncbi:unnamed protein product [Acanthosepion pharaonis]|uniref:Uncharacterized protein n=1 Tax=Acanthosepion pharaonis TaxID=158019 RepID=A0A812E065_ACAPH|nr:unnamed protein product [Sepia pharaonis]
MTSQRLFLLTSSSSHILSVLFHPLLSYRLPAELTWLEAIRRRRRHFLASVVLRGKKNSFSGSEIGTESIVSQYLFFIYLRRFHIYLSIYLSQSFSYISLSIYIYIYQSFSYIYLSMYLSMYRSIYLSQSFSNLSTWTSGTAFVNEPVICFPPRFVAHLNTINGDEDDKDELIPVSILIYELDKTGPTSISDQFPRLFDGAMGCIKNGKVTLHIDTSVTQLLKFIAVFLSMSAKM